MIFLPVRILWYKKMANIFLDYIFIISQTNTLVKFFVGTSVTKFKTLSHRRILIFCTITPTSHSWLFGMWAKNIPLEFVYTGVSASPAYCSSSDLHIALEHIFRFELNLLVLQTNLFPEEICACLEEDVGLEPTELTSRQFSKLLPYH